jgi:type IV fimbrial biogenesis protein FimT
MRFSKTHPSRLRGFTIIEIMIAVTLAAILMVVAAPGFRAMMARGYAQAVARDLLSAVNRARSEAITRRGQVVLCQSTDLSTCSGTNLSNGWIVFMDADGNGQRTTSGTTEPLIQIHNTVADKVTITATGGTNLSYRVIGTVSAARTFTVCPLSTGTGAKGGQIAVNTSGRPTYSDNFTCP